MESCLLNASQLLLFQTMPMEPYSWKDMSQWAQTEAHISLYIQASKITFSVDFNNLCDMDPSAFKFWQEMCLFFWTLFQVL